MGWGVIDVAGTRLSHVANGVISTDTKSTISERLVQLHYGLREVLTAHEPDLGAVEEIFVNKNPRSALKLGAARGVALLVPALAGVPVAEYAPNHIKKSVAAAGLAGKEQIRAMVGMLLPGARVTSEDAADALAVAICHAHHSATSARLTEMVAAGERKQESISGARI
jgi:crossover junction endodeoxyribonuclease RuvC